MSTSTSTEERESQVHLLSAESPVQLYCNNINDGERKSNKYNTYTALVQHIHNCSTLYTQAYKCIKEGKIG